MKQDTLFVFVTFEIKIRMKQLEMHLGNRVYEFEINYLINLFLYYILSF